MDNRSGTRTRPPFILGAMIVTFLLTASGVAGAECGPFPFLRAESWSGFKVSVDEAGTTVSFVSWQPNSPVEGNPGLFFSFEGILEELAQRAQILPVFVSLPPVCSAVDTSTSWTGESTLDVLKQLLADCNLTIVIRDGFGIVANPEMIDTTAVVLSIGPVAGDPLPKNAEEALYRDLYLHNFSLRYSYSSHSLYTVRVGYLSVSEDPDEYIVFAGTVDEMFGESYRVFRARIVGGERPSVQCQWLDWSGGPPVDSFTEDIDGDGIQDILINRSGQRISTQDEMVPSTIVSAKSGEELFSFILDKMAIQRTGGGLIRISALTRESHMEGEACLPVFEFSSTTGSYERVAVILDADPETPACTNAAARLATTWSGASTITMYDLIQSPTGGDSSYIPSGYENRVIPAAQPRTWSQNPIRIRGTEIAVEGTPGSRTMLAYMPSGYEEAIKSLLR